MPAISRLLREIAHLITVGALIAAGLCVAAPPFLDPSPPRHWAAAAALAVVAALSAGAGRALRRADQRPDGRGHGTA